MRAPGARVERPVAVEHEVVEHRDQPGDRPSRAVVDAERCTNSAYTIRLTANPTPPTSPKRTSCSQLAGRRIPCRQADVRRGHLHAPWSPRSRIVPRVAALLRGRCASLCGDEISQSFDGVLAPLRPAVAATARRRSSSAAAPRSGRHDSAPPAAQARRRERSQTRPPAASAPPTTTGAGGRRRRRDRRRHGRRRGRRGARPRRSQELSRCRRSVHHARGRHAERGRRSGGRRGAASDAEVRARARADARGRTRGAQDAATRADPRAGRRVDRRQRHDPDPLRRPRSRPEGDRRRQRDRRLPLHLRRRARLVRGQRATTARARSATRWPPAGCSAHRRLRANWRTGANPARAATSRSTPTRATHTCTWTGWSTTPPGAAGRTPRAGWWRRRHRGYVVRHWPGL